MKFKALAVGLALQTVALIGSIPAGASYVCDGTYSSMHGQYCSYVGLCESGGTEIPSTLGVTIDCEVEKGVCPQMNTCYRQLKTLDDVKELCTKFGNDCWDADIPTKDLPKGYSHK